MFERIQSKRTPKITLNMVENDAVEPVEDLEGLRAYITSLIESKAYVTFGPAAVLLGFAQMVNGSVTGFQNRDIGSITHYFDQAVPGASALIVNRKGCHDQKVWDQHRTFLVENGYEEGNLPRKSVKGVPVDQLNS